MPSAPEIFYGRGEIGSFKVLGQIDAQQPGGTQGNVRITGKITLELYGKEKGCQHKGKSFISRQIVIDLIHIYGQGIR